MIGLFALGSVILSFGFVLGWIACSCVVDLDEYEAAEPEPDADIITFPERPGA